jgi:hypothetical protein
MIFVATFYEFVRSEQMSIKVVHISNLFLQRNRKSEKRSYDVANILEAKGEYTR